MATSPLPDLSLIKMRRYSTMAVQYSRGCPFNCEFCDIIEIYGRQPRTKAIAHMRPWINCARLGGAKRRLLSMTTSSAPRRTKELCVVLAERRSQCKTSFDFNTETSLNLADDPELMKLMENTGFIWVFPGIDTPDESGLVSSNKLITLCEATRFRCARLSADAFGNAATKAKRRSRFAPPLVVTTFCLLYKQPGVSAAHRRREIHRHLELRAKLLHAMPWHVKLWLGMSAEHCYALL